MTFTPPRALLRRSLSVLTALALIGSAVIAMIPSTDRIPNLALESFGGEPQPLSPRSSADSLTRAVVAGNLFSPNRRPPATRYVPPDVEADELAASVSDSIVRVPGMETGVMTSTGVPAFFGTVAGPDGMRALLRLDAAIDAPQLYRPGDRAGPFRVVSIDTHRVVLSSRYGRTTLNLSPEVKRP